ncbi:hypothetical protein HYV86_00175 [Candidatus Woesearchaeota archaeon]|nr:hypothetical protein [Candidatus Woesearchaeota archaeon]
MIICISGSMHFTEKMLEVQKLLQALGHEVRVTSFASAFIGKNDAEKEHIKLTQKKDYDTLQEFWDLMQGADALLVLNLDRKGIKNYVGGNTFLEMGFAYVLGMKIFLYNPVPEIDLYTSEIESMKPIVINQDLKKII